MKNGLFHKRIARFAVALVSALFFVSCATTEGAQGSSAPQARRVPGGAQGGSAPQARKVPGGVPQFVKDAVRNAPEDALVGIGTANMATVSLSRTTAATRARAEISRQMQSIVRDMVRDYSAGSEVDHSAAMSFTEAITVSLSQSKLTGSSVVEEDRDENGAYWVVVMLNKTSTVNEINQAAAQAKLNAPKMASFDAEQRMNDAFDKLNAQEMQVGNR